MKKLEFLPLAQIASFLALLLFFMGDFGPNLYALYN
jgi:hypothetical protein